MALRIQDEHAGDVGTEECENEVRMVPIFKHTDEVWVPHIHSLRRNIPLALGNRHHLRSVFSSFPLACGNHTDTPLRGPLDIFSSRTTTPLGVDFLFSAQIGRLSCFFQRQVFATKSREEVRAREAIETVEERKSDERTIRFTRLREPRGDRADDQARRVPWQLLLETRNQYVEMQEFYFWARSVIETEDSIPRPAG